MTKDALVCSITSVNIICIFNIIRNVYRFDRAQMNSKNVGQFIIVKHSNRMTNCSKDDSFIES